MTVLKTINQSMGDSVRYGLSFIMAIGIFVLGGYKYQENSFFMPFWMRDYNSLNHGLFNFGNTGNIDFMWPVTIVMLISSGLLFFSIYKGLIKYPKSLNLLFIFMILVDLLVIATFINLFIFSGQISELVFYFGAFALGAFIFGKEEVSRYAVLSVFILVIVRLLFFEDAHFTAKYIVPLIVIFFVLRAPFNSEGFTDDLKSFSFDSLIGKK
ncbi:MAG: hypothetical protein IBX55_15175 [Methyloprofundus sp.]|nr:hypothetical protein [Methyloprofundus sp.]